LEFTEHEQLKRTNFLLNTNVMKEVVCYNVPQVLYSVLF